MIGIGAFVRRHAGRFGDESPRLFAAPGRINIIGEHTDYNGGFVLPMAIDRHTVAAMTPCRERTLRIHSETIGETVAIDLNEPFERRGGWHDYVAGVAAVVCSEQPLHHGAHISICADLPLGAGLSSSASLELCLAQALYALAGDSSVEARRIAAAGHRAEHEYVGIRSGVMDQLVCALAQRDCALLIDCRSLETRSIAIPANAAIAVCDTGVKHALAQSEYNLRREQCEEGVRRLCESGAAIETLRDLDGEAFEKYAHLLPEPVRSRCRHVVYENARTMEAVAAFACGDLQCAGELLNESHASLADLYEVSSPELDEVVRIARGVPGVYGARMTGGGFGGAAIALLDPEAYDALRQRLERAYYAPRAMASGVFLARACAGAHEILRGAAA